ncbi:MAG: 4Fe-4S dicluster domain-containing protein, partial [bacterium]
TSKAKSLPELFHNPSQPRLDDYYEPWTYDFQHLFKAPEGADQPTAVPISRITGKQMDIKAGPNWDDDLGGSPVYAANDPNLGQLSDEERRQLFSIEQMVMFYLPRICNHCLNPACVAACPSGALYKRGEDGIVLVDQKVCRAWRACVAACPYKKIYYNWSTGKSEKCILCFPRLETGQAPSCFHSCVGRIRYLGMVLYDADRLAAVASLPDDELVEGQRSLILDPSDPAVIAAARANGIPDVDVEYARRSPVYRFVKTWKLALPLHVEYRTLPMLFYVPPMAPVVSAVVDGKITHKSGGLFHDIDDSRIPLKFLAGMFGAGRDEHVRYALRKQKAVRWYRRALSVGDIDQATAERMLREADCTAGEAEEIYRLTALGGGAQRFVIPPMHREMAIEAAGSTETFRRETGFGFIDPPKRGP